MSNLLVEHLSYDQAMMEMTHSDEGKNLYLKGICIQGGVKNANQRVYPISEINRAIETLNKQVKTGYSVLGEVDHPTNLRINLDRVSHMITEMWLDGPNGYGKMKILPTPMGNLVRTMLESGVKLGVSSRGSGNVNEHDGAVSDFDIVTVDIVAQPSAPNAYPTAVYEGLMNMNGGHRILDMAKDLNKDQRVQKYLQEEIRKFVSELKI
jgi:Prohead core protein serine protease